MEEEEGNGPSANVKFHENLEEMEEDREEQSDYCEDLAELYQNDEDGIDMLKYQGIHLMNRQCEEDD